MKKIFIYLSIFILVLVMAIPTFADTSPDYYYVKFQSREFNSISEFQTLDSNINIDYIKIFDSQYKAHELYNVGTVYFDAQSSPGILQVRIVDLINSQFEIFLESDVSNTSWYVLPGSFMDGSDLVQNVEIAWLPSNELFFSSDIYTVTIPFLTCNYIVESGYYSNDLSNVAYTQGYIDGQNAAKQHYKEYYQQELERLLEADQNEIYKQGYADGQQDPMSNKVIDVVKGIIEAPFYLISKIFDLNLFGFNLAGLFFTIISIGIVIFAFKLWNGSR